MHPYKNLETEPGPAKAPPSSPDLLPGQDASKKALQDQVEGGGVLTSPRMGFHCPHSPDIPNTDRRKFYWVLNLYI